MNEKSRPDEVAADMDHPTGLQPRQQKPPSKLVRAFYKASGPILGAGLVTSAFVVGVLSGDLVKGNRGATRRVSTSMTQAQGQSIPKSLGSASVLKPTAYVGDDNTLLKALLPLQAERARLESEMDDKFDANNTAEQRAIPDVDPETLTPSEKAQRKATQRLFELQRTEIRQETDKLVAPVEKSINDVVRSAMVAAYIDNKSNTAKFIQTMVDVSLSSGALPAPVVADGLNIAGGRPFRDFYIQVLKLGEEGPSDAFVSQLDVGQAQQAEAFKIMLLNSDKSALSLRLLASIDDIDLRDTWHTDLYVAAIEQGKGSNDYLIPNLVDEFSKRAEFGGGSPEKKDLAAAQAWTKLPAQTRGTFRAFEDSFDFNAPPAPPVPTPQPALPLAGYTGTPVTQTPSGLGF